MDDQPDEADRSTYYRAECYEHGYYGTQEHDRGRAEMQIERHIIYIGCRAGFINRYDVREKS